MRTFKITPEKIKNYVDYMSDLKLKSDEGFKFNVNSIIKKYNVSNNVNSVARDLGYIKITGNGKASMYFVKLKEVQPIHARKVIEKIHNDRKKRYEETRSLLQKTGIEKNKSTTLPDVYCKYLNELKYTKDNNIPIIVDRLIQKYNVSIYTNSVAKNLGLIDIVGKGINIKYLFNKDIYTNKDGEVLINAIKTYNKNRNNSKKPVLIKNVQQESMITEEKKIKDIQPIHARRIIDKISDYQSNPYKNRDEINQLKNTIKRDNAEKYAKYLNSLKVLVEKNKTHYMKDFVKTHGVSNYTNMAAKKIGLLNYVGHGRNTKYTFKKDVYSVLDGEKTIDAINTLYKNRSINRKNNLNTEVPNQDKQFDPVTTNKTNSIKEQKLPFPAKTSQEKRMTIETNYYLFGFKIFKKVTINNLIQ